MKTIPLKLAGQSLALHIEAQRGRYRIKNGQARRYAADYGEIAGTKGADGDPIDVYWGGLPEAGEAFVINQYRANGTFDEHKVMLGFFDRAQAARAYTLSTGTQPEIHACTPAQLVWWLAHGNHKKPVTPQSFPFDSEQSTMQDDVWTDNVSASAAKLLYGWRKTDTGEELLEAATMDALLQTEAENGAQMDEATFDALAVPYKKLERTAQIIGVSLNRASDSLKVAENGIHISKPMKQNGTTNIAVMYEMTDGQTVSVFLHNPDTTPQKITPDDVLVSWKWLLNRKDITIAVAKENGRDLQIQQVARRVMALVEKNTARFAKANAQRAERIANLQKMEAQIAEKEAELADLTAQLEAKWEARKAERQNPERQAFTQYYADVISALENLYDWNGAYYSYSANMTTVAYTRLSLNTFEKAFELQTSWEKSISKKGNERETERFIYDAEKTPEQQAYEIQAYFIRLMANNGYPLAREKMPKQPETVSESPQPSDETANPNRAGSLNTEPLDESSLQPLNVPENATAKEVRKALESYLKQLQGKTVMTSDGKTVRFSRQTAKHIANDSVAKKLIVPQAIAHVVDVLKTGDFVGREPAYKERSDFVAFHAYRKWIELSDKEVLMQVKAAELPDGELEAGDGLLAYSAKDVTDKTKEADDTASFVTDGALGTSGNPGINPSVASSTTGTSAVPRENNHSATYDTAQDEPYIFVEILEVRDKQDGNSRAADAPSEPTEYSADNPYAAYARDDDEARQNADDWEARVPLTEAVLAQLNEKAERQGFAVSVEAAHASLGRFQAVKTNGARQALIDGEFKNHGGASVYEAARDFTVTLKDGDDAADYFYTNDFDAALEKAAGWLAESETADDATPENGSQENGAKQHDNPARAYLQAIIDGQTDVLGEGFDDEFLAFVEQHEQDETLRELLEQAVAVWQQAALNASENIK